MNRQVFNEYITYPVKMDEKGVQMVEDIIRRYPYCQSAHFLRAYFLFRCDDPRFQEVMKKSAAFLGDRNRLKTIESDRLAKKEEPFPTVIADMSGIEEDMVTVAGLQAHDHNLVPKGIADGQKTGAIPDISPMPVDKTQSTPESQSLPADAVPLSETAREDVPVGAEMPAPKAAIPSAENYSRDDLLAIVKKRLAEIQSIKAVQNNFETVAENTARAFSKADLIDRFLQEEPQISRPKASLLNAPENALKSSTDMGEIVTETLAKLYAEQGNIQKAIGIYQKLSLLNPEKSRYFAALIQKLRAGLA